MENVKQSFLYTLKLAGKNKINIKLKYNYIKMMFTIKISYNCESNQLIYNLLCLIFIYKETII